MKKLVLLLSIVFAVAMALSITIPALASSSDTTNITGSVQTAIDVNAPNTVSVGNLVPGTASESFYKTVTVKCNKAGWTLTVSDEWNDPPQLGHMIADLGTETAALLNPIEVKGNARPYAYLNTSVLLEDGSGASMGITNITDLRFRQFTDWNDALGNYIITVTFTGATP